MKTKRKYGRAKPIETIRTDNGVYLWRRDSFQVEFYDVVGVLVGLLDLPASVKGVPTKWNFKRAVEVNELEINALSFRQPETGAR